MTTPNNTKIVYTPDYRSPPSGCGIVSLPNGNTVLITDTAGKDYLVSHEPNPNYNYTVNIPFDIGVHWSLYVSVLDVILNNLGVTHVYDAELAYELNRDDNTFTLKQFILHLKAFS